MSVKFKSFDFADNHHDPESREGFIYLQLKKTQKALKRYGFREAVRSLCSAHVDYDKQELSDYLVMIPDAFYLENENTIVACEIEGSYQVTSEKLFSYSILYDYLPNYDIQLKLLIVSEQMTVKDIDLSWVYLSTLIDLPHRTRLLTPDWS
jgi:hypothetical protein